MDNISFTRSIDTEIEISLEEIIDELDRDQIFELIKRLEQVIIIDFITTMNWVFLELNKKIKKYFERKEKEND